MKFKDEYKKEMNCIKHNVFLDEAVLASGTDTVQISKWHISLKKCTAAVFAVLSMTVIANFSDISSLADSLLTKFGLVVSDNRIDMDEINPVDFNIEKFSSYDNVTMDTTDGTTYFTNSLNTDKLEEYTGIKLNESNDVILYGISISVSETYKNGHLTMYVSDGNSIDVHMNGQFLINGSDSSQFQGYGYDTGKIKEEYVCRNGSKAYFIKSNEQKYDKHRLTVIFCADDIQYQLFIDDTDENIQFAKKVADTMMK